MSRQPPGDRAPDAVAVLVPFRSGGCPHRRAAYEYVTGWWREHFPRWDMITATCGDGPWCKATAVANAAASTQAPILVVADADVICEQVGVAVRAVDAGAVWAIPHRPVYRLSEEATAAVHAGAPFPDAAMPPRRTLDTVADFHTGAAGGGMVVLARSTWERVPMDPRFLGWGQEDLAWGRALAVMAGIPWRAGAPLWHLWHPPAPRESRTVGSAENVALYQRYRRAHSVEAMRALLAEIPLAAAR